MSKKSPDLWNRPERQALENRRGSLFSEAQRLSQLMYAERRHLVKEKDAGGTRLIRPEISFRYTDTDGEYIPQLVEVHVVKGDPNIYLAHDSDSRDADMSRYSITPDGIITNIDMYSDPVDSESAEFDMIKTAMGMVSRAMEQDQRDRSHRSERRRRTAMRSIATLGALGLAASAATIGINRFVLEPRREEAERRDAYDSQNHILPGEPAPIDTYEFGELTKKEFLAIPSLQDGEPLTHPRIVEIDSTSGCVDIDVKAAYAEEFTAAAQEGADLLEYTYQIDTSQDGITMCIVDHQIGGKVAVQSLPVTD